MEETGERNHSGCIEALIIFLSLMHLINLKWVLETGVQTPHFDRHLIIQNNFFSKNKSCIKEINSVTLVL